MKKPTIEIIPVRSAVRTDAPLTLEVMLRITPPAPETQMQRPALNLGLVLDHSGSMRGHNKITFAREAAIFAMQQLLPTDRVSVTIFDSEVETIIPNTLADNKERLIELIQRIEPRGSTALHAGWMEGGKQTQHHLLAGGLNRVILLSDGLANVGEQNPDNIATDVSRLARAGVSTTTMGVGDDYNEDLLEAMANSGDGNYYYIESPQQLPDMFQSELQGLMATFGNTVSLGIEPCAGATVVEVLNDLDRLPTGRKKLPNLMYGMPINIVVRLEVPPSQKETEWCRCRLAWNAPKQSQRQSLVVSLRLPSVDGVAWEALTPNLEVSERTVLLLIARYKKEATLALQQHDREGTERSLTKARKALASAPQTNETRQEEQKLAEIEEYLRSGALDKFSKHAKYQAHQRRRSEKYRDS
jgi:Ca-activated chloride channel family protein